MTNQVIPDEAVEAAVTAHLMGHGSHAAAIRAILEAAAPHMLAAAFDEGAEMEHYRATYEEPANPYRTAK